MLTNTLLAFISLFGAAVTAQEAPTFDAGSVPQDKKDTWCSSQLNTCPQICEEFAKDNTCDSTRLTFSCVCSDDEEPNVGQYINTLPFFICEETFKQCIADHPDDADGQKVCKDASKKCGSKNATESSDSPSTTTSASSSSATLTTMTESPSPTAQEEEPTDSPNAGIPMQLAQDYSLGVLATVFFGLFGFIL